MLAAMNRVIVGFVVLALAGAGIYLGMRSASRADGEPTRPAASNGAAEVDGQRPSPEQPQGRALAVGEEAQQPTPPPAPPVGPQSPFTRRGRVVDEAGQGVAGLSVAVVHRPVEFGGPIADTGRFLARTVTDDEGRFALSVQNPSGKPSVQWVGPLHGPDAPPFIGPAQQVDFDPALADVELELRVIPGKTIAGRVLLDAVQGQSVDEVRLMAIGQLTGHSANARIDAEGRFLLELLYDEAYLVVASASRAVSPLALDVRTGTQDLVLALQPVGAVRVDVEGGSPPGLRIECARVGGEPEELARMGLSGRSPQFLLPGAYTIAVYTQDMYACTSVDSVGTREAPLVVPVKLEPAALVDVWNKAEEPRIVVVENAGRVVRAQSLPLAGRAMLSVPPGSFTVHEHLIDGTLVVSHPMALGPNASLELELR
jgi:hypothetical protein